MAREGLTEKVAFKLIAEESKGKWGKNIPGRGNSKCKGPKAGSKRRIEGDNVREESEKQSGRVYT